jgi:hypothetical protein
MAIMISLIIVPNTTSIPTRLTARAVLVCLLWLPLAFAIAQPDPSVELRRQQEREEQLLE